MTTQAEPLTFQIVECSHCTDLWTWVVRYRDGDELKECPGNDVHHSFADIDQERAVSMALIPKRTGLSQLLVHITTPSMRPVFFRRRYLALNIGSDTTSPHETIHCLGWQDGVVESYAFAFEDGGVLLTADRQAV